MNLLIFKPIKWRKAFLLGLSWLMILPASFGQGEELANRQSVSFRLNLVRNANLTSNGQTPPYFWSGVYVQNAFNPDAQLSSFRLDSSLCGMGIAATQQFGEEIKAYYAYNPEGLLAEVIFKQERPGPVYENFSRKVYTYTNGKLTSYLYQLWNLAQGEWQDDYEELTSYNAEGKQERFQIREVDMSGQWQNLFREMRNFDQDGNIIEVLSGKWNNGSWLDTARKEITYNEVGLYRNIYEAAWNGSSWDTLSRESTLYGSNGISWEGYLYERNTNNGFVNEFREIYGYNFRGYWTQMTQQSWDTQSNSWKNVSRESYDYTRNGIWIGWIRQDWIDTTWIDRYRQRFELDGNNRFDVRQNWDATNSTWVNEARNLARYDADFNLSEEAGLQVWNSSTWENTAASRRCVHFWSEQMATSIGPKLPMISCNMTNPYRAYSPITCDALEPGKSYQVKLSDMQGRSVLDRHLSGGNSFTIDRTLPSGIYTLNIYQDNQIRFARKVLIKE